MAVSAQTLDDIYAAMDKLTKPLSAMLDDLKLFSKNIEEVQDKLAGATPAAKELKDALEKVGAGQEALSKAGSALTSAGTNVLGAVKAPLEAYEKAEEAVAGLKAQMTGASGVAPKSFEAVDALATRLGETLPGTTADFEAMMATLMRNGASAQDVLGGLGNTTANLATALKMPAGEAANFAMKLQAATQTGTKDMNGLAEVVQRAFHAGVNQNDLLKAFSAMSPVLGQLKQQGLAGTQALTPLLVMANQVGVAGEAAGKAYQNVFANLQKTDKIKSAAKSAGVSLDFGDGAGGLANIDQIVAQFAKLKGLTGEKRESVLKSMFGDDKNTLAVVSTMIDKGVGGYTEVQQKLAAQADIQTRVNQQATTLKEMQANAGESLEGLLGTLGSALAPQAKQLLGFITELTTATNNWAKAHPELVHWIMGAVAVVGGLLVGLGGLLSAAAAVFTPFMMINSAMKGFKDVSGAVSSGLSLTSKALETAGGAGKRAFDTLATGIKGGVQQAGKLFEAGLEAGSKFADKLGPLMSSAYTRVSAAVGNIGSLLSSGFRTVVSGLSTGLSMIGRAFGAVTGFLAANPIILAIAAIAAAAFLIYQYWEPIKAFFINLWSSINGVFAKYPILNYIFPIIGIARALINNWDVIKGFFVDLWNQVVSACSNAVTAISGFFDGWSPLDAISAGWDAVSSFFSDLWDGISTDISDGVDTISSFFDSWSPLDSISAVWDSVSSFFSDLWNGVSDTVSGAVDGIANYFSTWSPLEAISSAFTSVINYFSVDLPAKFSEFGGMILQGLTGGFTNGIGNVLQTIEGAGSALIGRFRSILGIHSPSAVFAELGRFTMAGLDNGLQAAQDGPLGTLMDVGDQLISAGSNAVGMIGQGISPIFAGGMSLAGAGGGGGAAGGSFVFNIHPSAGMDEKALADLVAQKFADASQQRNSAASARLADED